MRYAFDDEESDEELDEVLAPTVTANLTESIPAAQKLTLVVGIHGPASAYLEFLREPGAIVGHISFKVEFRFESCFSNPPIEFALAFVWTASERQWKKSARNKDIYSTDIIINCHRSC